MPNALLRLMLALGLVAAHAAPPARAADAPGADPAVIDLRVWSGLRQRALLLAPPASRAALVMLPGGSGVLGITSEGRIRHGANFVVRTRAAWVERGRTVLIPDAVDGTSLRGRRSTPFYAQVVARLAAAARTRVGGPVFLVGTSQGAIAAVNGAAHAPPGLVDGIVLLEPVSVMGGSGETVFSADPAAVRVPVLVVVNRDDGCKVAPPDMERRVVAAFRASPSAEAAFVAGGSDRSGRPCGSRSPHGYAGIEPAVIALVASWLRAHGG